MGFELRVTFTGLCLFLIQKDCKRVAVIQPDSRLKGRLLATHPDGETAIHHAGYLRYDEANLASGSKAPEPVENPLNEIVHHFRYEDLKFNDLDDPEAMTIETGLPAMEWIVPVATNPAPPLPGQEKPDCPAGEETRLKLINWRAVDAPLAMRTILAGGRLDKTAGLAEWAFLPYAFEAGGREYRGDFATEVTWTRSVPERDFLKLSITPFTGAPTRDIILHPTETASENKHLLLLRIANLCSDNPLEWKEFPTPRPAREDRDFKWFYQLFRNADDSVIKGMVPIPILQGGAAGVENCIGLRTTVPTVG
jgi:hypothetical protein